MIATIPCAANLTRAFAPRTSSYRPSNAIATPPDEQTEHPVRMREEQRGDVVLPEEETEQRYDESQDDGDATDAWDRLRVDLPRAPCAVETAEPGRPPTHERRQRRRHAEGKEKRHEKGTHRCYSGWAGRAAGAARGTACGRTGRTMRSRLLEVETGLRLAREVAFDEVAAAAPHARSARWCHRRGGAAWRPASEAVLRRDEHAGARVLDQPASFAVDADDDGPRSTHELEDLGGNDAAEQRAIAQHHQRHVGSANVVGDGFVRKLIEEEDIREPLAGRAFLKAALLGTIADQEEAVAVVVAQKGGGLEHGDEPVSHSMRADVRSDELVPQSESIADLVLRTSGAEHVEVDPILDHRDLLAGDAMGRDGVDERIGDDDDVIGVSVEKPLGRLPACGRSGFPHASPRRRRWRQARDRAPRARTARASSGRASTPRRR